MKYLATVWAFFKRAFGEKENEEVDPVPTPDPSDTGIYLSNSEVREKITNQLQGKLIGLAALKLPDTIYYCPTLEYTKEILSRSIADTREYVAEWGDCDDFAIMLKADFILDAYRDGKRRAPHCMGAVWGLLPGPHALNWVINSDGVLRFIEPQSDAIFIPRATDKKIQLILA